VILITPVLDGLYYRLGWLSPDGKPANSKIIYTVAAFVSIALCARMGLRMVEKAIPVEWPYVGLVTVVLSFAAGVEVFKKVVNYLASKAPGTTTTTSRPSQATEPTP
jgi:hypothetical protein